MSSPLARAAATLATLLLCLSQSLAQEAVDSLAVPRGSWHFSAGFGSASWGQRSPCACSSPTLDVAVSFEGLRGWGIEYKPTLANTNSGVLDHSFNALFFPKLGMPSPRFGAYAGFGLLTPLGQTFLEERPGSSYTYGVRARARLGGRQRTHVFGDVGVVVFRQLYRQPEQPWARITSTIDTRTVHSGLRIRVGVRW